MSNRRGTYSGRYGSEMFTTQGLSMYRKDRELKAKNKKKYNKKRRVARYLEDGKISSKEAKKLIKKGISMSFVENFANKEYRDALKRQRDKNAQARGRDQLSIGNMPSYQPISFSTKARKRMLQDLLGINKPKPEPKPKPKAEEDQKVSVDPIPFEPEAAPEPTIEEPETPTSPYSVSNPVTIRNPAKRRLRGGIGQFGTGGGGTRKTLQSKLLNV